MTLISPTPLTIALRMAEKHTNPSTIRRSKYRKTIDLRSASGWTKWNLDLFNAKFEKHKYTDLRSYLGDDAYRMDPQFDDGKAIWDTVDISCQNGIGRKQTGDQRRIADVVRGRESDAEMAK